MDRQKQNLIDFAKLVAARNTEFDRLEELARELLADVEAPRTELETQFFEQAKGECLGNNEVEIDEDAVVSLSEAADAENYKDGIAGAFVQAWVFVQAEELDTEAA